MNTAAAVAVGYVLGAAATTALIFAPGLRTLTPTERAWLIDGHRASRPLRRKP